MGDAATCHLLLYPFFAQGKLLQKALKTKVPQIEMNKYCKCCAIK